MKCEQTDSCSSWAIIDDVCHMNNFEASPGDFGGTQAVFTTRRPGNLIRKTTVQAPTQITSAQNLLGGFYNHGAETCCLIGESLTPRTAFIRFDFATPTLVKEVAVRSHYDNYPPELLTDQTKVYAIESGNWNEVGNFPGGKHQETRSIYLSPPRRVDAIAISQDDGRKLTICMVEIF